MHLRNRITAGFSTCMRKKLKVTNGWQTGDKGDKRVTKLQPLTYPLSCVIRNLLTYPLYCVIRNIVRIPFLCYQKRGSGVRAITEEHCQQLTNYHPRSHVSYNTRKWIRQKVSKLQPLQPFCNLCNPFATRLQPFKKHLNKSKTLIQCGFTACMFYLCNLCNLFSRVLVYREKFFYFLFSQHNP